MKKLIVIASIFIFTFAIAIGIKADGMQLKSIDAIMAEIRLEQGVQTNKSIDVSKVSQTRLEELGDSVMEKIVGNTAMHDQMDLLTSAVKVQRILHQYIHASVMIILWEIQSTCDIHGR